MQQRSTTAGWWILLLVTLGGGLPAGASSAPDGILLFTGAVNGYLDQCGCARFPLGGLDRRASLAARLRAAYPKSALVWLDGGNFFDTPGPGGEVKTRALVEAMGRLGCVVSGVGERDLLMGVPTFLELTKDAAFPLISTNLVRRSTGEPWLSPGTVVLVDGMRVAVLAVTRENPSFSRPLPDGDELVTDAPAAAVTRFLPRFRQGADLVVVLALLSIDEARLLARRVPEIDLILGAHGSALTAEAIREGRTTIVYAGNEGKNVGQIELFADPEGGRPSLVTRVRALGDDLTPDREMEAFVVERLAAAQEAERNARVSGAPDGAEAGKGVRYLGPGSCTACHSTVVADWSGTPHARAWETLQRNAKRVRRNCVACHVTGFEQPSGFTDAEATPHLLSVGCEACHGPAGDHVAAPDRPYGAISIATCTSCHTAEMDPAFNYYRDLKAVSHGLR